MRHWRWVYENKVLKQGGGNGNKQTKKHLENWTKWTSWTEENGSEVPSIFSALLPLSI